MECRLKEVAGAAQVQRSIDEVARGGGGRVVLPEMELTLDRGLELRSGVELVGQGEGTVLRKGPGRVYPLSGYHNYGMCDVPLKSAGGLEVGMTVSVHDGRTHGGFYETFARITWIDGNWVGLDHGLEADYQAEEEPCLTTVYPLVFGHGVRDVALRDMHLEGNRAQNEKAMGGCRGGAVYWGRSRNIELTGISERDYYGEGLSFQMCRDVRIRDCSFEGNTGNGLHPGAGSTRALFARCRGVGNQGSGFFFCVRANHITVRGCEFGENALGVSIGTRDCHNLIEGCLIEGNRGAGLRARPTPKPTEVHSCRVCDCDIRGNALGEGEGQVEILGEARDLILEKNRIAGDGSGKAGVLVAPGAGRIYLENNHFEGCEPEVAAAAASLSAERPQIECGYGRGRKEHFRHLPL